MPSQISTRRSPLLSKACWAASFAFVVLATVGYTQTQRTRSPISGAPTGVTAFTDVNVVPMDTERVLPRQTVLVQNGWITAVGLTGQVQIPAGAQRIDGRGKYLMPGLADMHAHLTMAGHWRARDSASMERQLFIWLANGVTTIRSMDRQDANELTLQARAWAASGKILSPRLYVAGFWPGSFQSENVPLDSVTAFVTAYKAKGYDFIKPYRETGALYDSLHAAARRVGLPLMGHVPMSPRYPLAQNIHSLEQALKWGQASVEHLTGYTFALLKEPRALFQGDTMLRYHPDSLAAQRKLIDFSKIPALAGATARARVWNSPTHFIFEIGNLEFRTDTIDWGPELGYFPPARRAEVLKEMQAFKAAGQRAASDYNRIVLANASGMLDARNRLIKALQDSGAGLLLGTDHPAFTLRGMPVVPGVIVHRELQSLVRAGLTPYQALATGTKNVGTFVTTFFKAPEESGTVTVGKRADLVLLNGNPLVDIHNTMQSAGVMIGGRWLAREEIDRRLAIIQAASAAGR